VIIGYSQGARLALALAARHPHKVDRLVLESGSPGLRRRHDRAQRRAADDAMASLILEHGVDSFVTKWALNPLFAGLQKLPTVEREALHARRSTHSAAGLAAALRCLGQGSQPDYWPSLIKILRPTLVLSGSLDHTYTRLARRMVTDLPLGWRKTFRGVGHAPHLECPVDYANELESFLAPAWRSEPSELVP
jgi:2-succinyl-6-hydroxy-2,4-cyclohexadiene-1-carboxylate synthase